MPGQSCAHPGPPRCCRHPPGPLAGVQCGQPDIALFIR